MNMPLLPKAIVSQHTVQDGASIALPFFLQCLASIFTTGSFATESTFARFLRALPSASYSLIRLTISKKASSFCCPVPPDAKLLLKLFINMSGETP